MNEKYGLDQVSVRMILEAPLYSDEEIQNPQDAIRILGDAFKEGRIFEVPSQVYENEDKALKVKIILPNANGEKEEFIVSVR